MEQHATVVGLFAQRTADLLSTQGRESTFYAPGMLHLALANLAFAASDTTKQELIRILNLEGVLGERTV